ncbi:unnamed protein product [Closterium sp. NIES-65]|nr:unnamed protein product [Closterium sp. NIES-65]
MASGQHGSLERGAGSAQGSTPGSPPRPMKGRVGDGCAGAGACFVRGSLSIASPTSRHSFRYDGPRPPPSGQTWQESGSEEEDEEEEGEGEEDEDDEGSGDDSEAGWEPETHGGGEGGDNDKDHEMDGLEPKDVEEETSPRRGYKGVLDGYVDRWPHAKSWPHLAKKKEKASGGGGDRQAGGHL